MGQFAPLSFTGNPGYGAPEFVAGKILVDGISTSTTWANHGRGEEALGLGVGDAGRLRCEGSLGSEETPACAL
jgi:hypothetical protein